MISPLLRGVIHFANDGSGLIIVPYNQQADVVFIPEPLEVQKPTVDEQNNMFNGQVYNIKIFYYNMHGQKMCLRVQADNLVE